jgi:hypothetical protein
MLHAIDSHTDEFFKFIREDPVRPHIPEQKRISPSKQIFCLHEDNKPQAITCVSYQSSIPVTEDDLFNESVDPDIAVFYTIWSYAPGAGRQLIMDAVNFIKNERKNIKQFVTLSPPTDMARRFHIKNGASVYRINNDTVNYEYKG